VDHLRLTAQAASRQIILAHTAEAPDAPPGVTPEPIPDVDAAMAWFTAELPMLEATVAYLGRGSFRLWELALPATIYLQRIGRYRTWHGLAQGALDAAVDAGDLLGEAHTRRMLAGASLYLGHPDVAGDQLELARDLFERLGLRLDQATALRNMGAVREQQGRSADALASYERALELLAGTDRRQAQALNLLGAGRALNTLGRPDEALDRVRVADDILEELDDINSLADTAEALADIQHSMGRYDESIASRRRAAKVFGEIGNRANESTAYLSLSETYLSAGRPEAAQEAVEVALSLAEDLGAAEHLVLVRRRITELEKSRQGLTMIDERD
jgi:tetratricopeptide (TPR) repeat protein